MVRPIENYQNQRALFVLMKKKPIISLIAAISENYVIGANNKLVWNMPADLAYYKNTIRQRTIIMGRKTAESEDMFFSEKQNILITRQPGYSKEGFEVATSLEEAFTLAQEDAVFITGGEQIYRMALPLADHLYLTKIHAVVEGDAQFPWFPMEEWELGWAEEHSADAENPFAYTFQRFDRKPATSEKSK